MSPCSRARSSQAEISRRRSPERHSSSSSSRRRASAERCSSSMNRRCYRRPGGGPSGCLGLPEEDLELHHALVLHRDETADVRRFDLVVRELDVEAPDDLDVAPVPAAFQRDRHGTRDTVQREIALGRRAHGLSHVGDRLEVDRLGQHELRLRELLRFEPERLDAVVAHVAIRLEAQQVGVDGDVLHGHPVDREAARDLARAAGGGALDANCRQLLLHAVPDEALGFAGCDLVAAVERAAADGGRLRDLGRRLGVALEEEVPTADREDDEHDDHRAQADQDLRQPAHRSLRGSPHATGSIRTKGVRGSATLTVDEATPHSFQHRHRHSLANAGARRSPLTVHFGGRFFVPRKSTVTHSIGIIGGDGIGPEVVAEALKVVDATGVPYDAVVFDLGGARYLRTGEVLPDSELGEIGGLDAVLLGAVGTPDVPPGVLERGLLLRLRFELDLYVNLRPFKAGPSALNTGVDCVVVRENTEGVYAGEGGFLRKGTPNEVATQGSVNTRLGVERCVRFAFDLAHRRERRHVTLVHKTNVLTFAGDLWQRTFDDVAAEHADTTTAYHHVDAACIHLVQDPGRYDVIVTDNLFGDILTDLGGAVSGGIGRAASANLNPARTGPSVFEPVHGSAPDIAGTGQADPRAAIISVGMLLDFLGEAEAAARVEKAVAASDDVAGTTSEIGDLIAERV